MSRPVCTCSLPASVTCTCSVPATACHHHVAQLGCGFHIHKRQPDTSCLNGLCCFANHICTEEGIRGRSPGDRSCRQAGCRAWGSAAGRGENKGRWDHLHSHHCLTVTQHRCCEALGEFFVCRADLPQNTHLCDEPPCSSLRQPPCQIEDWACTYVREWDMGQCTPCILLSHWAEDN